MILGTAKVDDHTIEVEFEIKSVKAQFTVSQLTAQRAAIQDQKDRDNAQRDKELADVDAILSACDTLKIADLPIDADKSPKPL